MKEFLIRLAAFGGIALAGYALLLWATIYLNTRATQHCRFGPETEYVLLGDSHTMWSIDDSRIDGLRNVSLNAEGYRYTYAKLVHILDNEPTIKKVYIGVGYHNLSSYFDDYIDGHQFRHFAYRYLGILAGADYAHLLTHDPASFPGLTLALIRSGLPAGLKQKCLLYGSFPSEHRSEAFSFESMQKRIREQYHDGEKVAAESKSNEAYLQRIVDLCRARGIPVAIVNTPLHPEYEKRIPDVYRRAYRQFISRNGLEHYGFDDLELGDASFLPDGDHLNYEGAVRATKAFARYHESSIK